MYFLTFLLILTQCVRTVSLATIQLPWTTESYAQTEDWEGFRRMGPYGPDGPWQGLAIQIGNFLDPSSNTENPLLTPMWPAFDSHLRSAVITDKGGGRYAVDKSTMAVKTRLGNSRSFENEKSEGRVYFDVMGIVPKFGGRTEIKLNTSINAVDMWVHTLPDGRNYTEEVGILGLGDTGMNDQDIFGNATPPAIIQALHTLGEIASMSACWHIGSVPLKQPGSFVLGGYDQSRAIGQVGEFIWDPVRGSTMFLLDVFMGTWVGSPALPDYEASIWRNASISETASSMIKMNGGKAGSAMVSLDATIPYINLPLGVCEEAARRLPVFWDAGIGLYLWDTTNPQYTRIVQSPAYLAFVFADRTATNLTIVVPMQLLNLTLESPLVSTPTPYFPCKPENSTMGQWSLGRAFLQAAFVAYRLDQNRTFLAQAPGPDVGQSVIRELQPTDTTFQTTSNLDEFERSWRSSWIIPVPEDRGGLSAASISGIGVGTASALVLMLVGVWFWRQHKTGLQADSDAPDGDGRVGGKESKDGGLIEMEGDPGVKMKSELGVDLPLEMEVPVQERQELSPQTFYYELPAESPRDIEKGSDVKHGDPS